MNHKPDACQMIVRSPLGPGSRRHRRFQGRIPPLGQRASRLACWLLSVALLLAGWAPAASGANQDGRGSAQVRLELSISERKLHVYRDGKRVRSFRVAVGKKQYPTPKGKFRIHRIDWNPDWTPPDSDWANGSHYTPPGHRDNPMGRARLVYKAPYSIHGTREVDSLGRAASHGSVRMANKDVIELGRLLMEAGGAGRSKAWLRRVLDKPTEMVTVKLPKPITLENAA
jgi:hypothetical protein